MKFSAVLFTLFAGAAIAMPTAPSSTEEKYPTRPSHPHGGHSDYSNGHHDYNNGHGGSVYPPPNNGGNNGNNGGNNGNNGGNNGNNGGNNGNNGNNGGNNGNNGGNNGNNGGDNGNNGGNNGNNGGNNGGAPYMPCIEGGLLAAATPQCCATDVLGVANLDCENAPSTASAADFQSSCGNLGKSARCCAIPILGQALVCNDPQGL